eukprot:jgi/Chlat1/34/ChrspC232803S00915
MLLLFTGCGTGGKSAAPAASQGERRGKGREGEGEDIAASTTDSVYSTLLVHQDVFPGKLWLVDLARVSGFRSPRPQETQMCTPCPLAKVWPPWEGGGTQQRAVS